MRRILSIFAFAILAFSLSAQESGRPIRRFALFIGSNAGGPNRAELKYAEKDARAMSAVMSELGGLAPRDERLLLTPDKRTFLRELSSVRTVCTSTTDKPFRTEFLFYYSGHSDEEGIFLGNEKIAYTELKNLIGDIGAEVNLVVLDSCSSGAMTRLKGGTKSQPFLVDESSSMKGHAYLTSSSEYEATQESDKIQGSFFTYYLVAGLRGAADSSGDGKITLNEAYSHAFAETLARTESTIAGPQHPSYNIRLTGSGDLVLTDMRSAETKMVFDEAIKGRIMIRDEDEHLVAETLKNTDKSMELSLPQGIYSVTLICDGKLLKTQVQLSRGKPQRVGIATMTPMGLETAARRGSTAEDDEPVRIDAISLSILSINSLVDELKIAHRFSLSLIGEKSYAIYGCQLSIGFGVISTELEGAQITSCVNYVGENAFGIQIAAGANIVRGSITGVQIAPINYAGTFSGPQIGVFNVANYGGKNAFGIQIAGGANIAGGNVTGVQLAPINYASTFTGPQIGALNIGVAVNGLQLGTVNIAGTSNGSQIGVMNIAGHAHGVQVGLVNAFGSNDGYPIGLINIVLKGGQTHLLTLMDERQYVTTALIHGTRHLYNIYGVGVNLDSEMKVWELGFGYATNMGRFTLNTELLLDSYAPDFINLSESSEAEAALKGRLYIGYSFHEHFSLVAGVSYNLGAHTSADSQSGAGSLEMDSLSWDALKKWPGFFFGIRL